MNLAQIKDVQHLCRGVEAGQLMTQIPDISEMQVGKWYTQTKSEIELLISMQKTKRRGELIRLDESEKRVVADIWRRKPSNKVKPDYQLVGDCIRAL